MRVVKVPPKIAHNDIAQSYFREMNDCVKKNGVIRRSDYVDLVKRAYNTETKTVDKKAAEALAHIADEFKPMMDAETRVIAEEFKATYYVDLQASPVLEEYRRQAKEQLAQGKEDWDTFLKTDLKEHQKTNFDDFKKLLKERRVDVSEQQAVELWAKFGHKKTVVAS